MDGWKKEVDDSWRGQSDQPDRSGEGVTEAEGAETSQKSDRCWTAGHLV